MATDIASGSEDNRAAIHMVSAWASANGLCLWQSEVDEKSNEITAIPLLHNLLGGGIAPN